MSIFEQQIQEVELSIRQAEEIVERADAFQRLQDNKDFQIVIEKGYFVDEAKRAVLLRADPNAQKPEQQAQINNVITAIGGLFQYFHTIVRLGNSAQVSLMEDKATKEQILQEEMEGEVLQ